MKRYNLALPEELFNQVQQVADDQNTTVVDILKKFIQLGLKAEQPGVELVIREVGKADKTLLIL